MTPAELITAHFGGVWHGSYGLFPAPGHSAADRGVSVKDIDDGDVLFHSFNGADVLAIKDECRRLGLLPEWPKCTNSNPWRITGTFEFRDETEKVLYRTKRLERPGEAKWFVVERPDGCGGWTSGTGKVRRVLYRLPELLASDPTQPVYLVEGERKADKLADWGLTATAIAFGCNAWLRVYAEALKGRYVVILPDNDGPGREFAETARRGIEAAGGTAMIVELPGLPPKGDVLDWTGSADDLRALVDAKVPEPGFDEANSAESTKPPLRPLALDEFLRREFPPKELLLEPWLPAKGLALVFAPRGAGKTHVALGVAYAVATGGKFLKWSAPAPRKVLVIDGEMPAATLQERIANIVAKSEVEPPSGDYFRILAADITEFGLPDISTSEGQDALEPHIGDAQLIVVDNISTICRSGKENEAESWAIVQDWALKQRRAGRSVLFIHHAGKGGEQRGTSKREDVMDSVIKLSHPEDYSPVDGARFIVSFTKSRGFTGPDAEPFEATLREGEWSTKALEDIRTAQILELHAEGLSQRDIAKEIDCGLGTVNRTIKQHQGGSNAA